MLTQKNALPEGLTKQLKAALLILEAIDEVYSNDLSFEKACDLHLAKDRLHYLLDEPGELLEFVEYSPSQRQEVIRKADLLMEAEAA
jgi:hypothetical protein